MESVKVVVGEETCNARAENILSEDPEVQESRGTFSLEPRMVHGEW